MNDIGIIGLGTLGSAIARGLHRELPRLRIFATTRTSAVPHDVTRCASNADLAARTRTLVLCVKPVHALAVLRELAPVLTRGHRVISTCAAVPLEQRHFDAVTALSGCGPAYICTIAEALGDAGIKAGLPREVARRMAVQTLLGSSVLLRSAQEHPAVIRDRVTTPGGCTTEALAQLEEGALRATLIAAVGAAAEKSVRLSSAREMPRADVPPCAV